MVTRAAYLQTRFPVVVSTEHCIKASGSTSVLFLYLDRRSYIAPVVEMFAL
jgi:hypothetical protein